MIKATELRIGNLVQQGEVVRVLEGAVRVKYELDGIEKHSIVHCEDLQPVTLTEELFVKLGFTDWAGSFSLKDFYISNHNYELSEMPDFYYELVAGGEVRLKYVHQLQNLYHALTGEELEVIEVIT